MGVVRTDLYFLATALWGRNSARFRRLVRPKSGPAHPDQKTTPCPENAAPHPCGITGSPLSGEGS